MLKISLRYSFTAMTVVSEIPSRQVHTGVPSLPVSSEPNGRAVHHTRSSQRRSIQSVYFNCGRVWLFAIVLGIRGAVTCQHSPKSELCDNI